MIYSPPLFHHYRATDQQVDVKSGHRNGINNLWKNILTRLSKSSDSSVTDRIATILGRLFMIEIAPNGDWRFV
jgi:hypothetical protein